MCTGVCILKDGLVYIDGHMRQGELFVFVRLELKGICSSNSSSRRVSSIKGPISF